VGREGTYGYVCCTCEREQQQEPPSQPEEKIRGIDGGVEHVATLATTTGIEESKNPHFIKSSKFSLSGKKALLKSDVEFEEVLIDAAESPIERLKKEFAKRSE
jgi:transposase